MVASDVGTRKPLERVTWMKRCSSLFERFAKSKAS